MEIGQKNLCPVCSIPSPAPESGKETGENPAGKDGDYTAYSPDLANLLESFVKENLQNWNLKFDDFYDSLQEKAENEVDYEAAVAQCKRWSTIFAEIIKILGKKLELSADLMIEIRKTIPGQFPEISAAKARSLAREFFRNVPRGDYSMIYMPQNGRLQKVPPLRRKFSEGDVLFEYCGAEKSNVPGVVTAPMIVAAPFDCTVSIAAQVNELKLKGEVIAVLNRISKNDL